jgi:tetratricopeptide (TPR) repeat protein
MRDNIYSNYKASDQENTGVSGVLKIKKEEIVDKKSKSTQKIPNISLSETNYNKATFFYENNSFVSAEKLLLENLELGVQDAKTFDMLINIYRKTGDYQKLIKTLDIAIKRCTVRKLEYRQLKKSFILEQILKDMKSV